MMSRDPSGNSLRLGLLLGPTTAVKMLTITTVQRHRYSAILRRTPRSTTRYCIGYCIGLSRYIAITNLSVIAVFVEYLRQFLIDLHQINRHSVCHKTRLREFFQLFSSSGFRARRRCDFFVTLFVPWCSESLDCLTLA